MNAIGGCCGTGPEHIAAIAAMAAAYKPRERPTIPPLMRLSGLEPLNYQPDPQSLRRTFLNIGERCNVAGSIIYKKAIVEGDYDKAAQIALQQVGGAGAHAGGGSVRDLGGPGLPCCRPRHSGRRGCLRPGQWRQPDRLCLPATPLSPPPQVNQGAHVLDINMDDGLIEGVGAMTRFVNLLVSDPEISKVGWAGGRAVGCAGGCVREALLRWAARPIEARRYGPQARRPRNLQAGKAVQPAGAACPHVVGWQAGAQSPSLPCPLSPARRCPS